MFTRNLPQMSAGNCATANSLYPTKCIKTNFIYIFLLPLSSFPAFEKTPSKLVFLFSLSVLFVDGWNQFVCDVEIGKVYQLWGVILTCSFKCPLHCWMIKERNVKVHVLDRNDDREFVSLMLCSMNWKIEFALFERGCELFLKKHRLPCSLFHFLAAWTRNECGTGRLLICNLY